MNIRKLLDIKIYNAMARAGIPPEYTAHVTQSKPQGKSAQGKKGAPAKLNIFGDYQANGAMAAAKAMKTNPRDLAQKIIDELDLEGIAGQVSIAGPGFINIHLDNVWLAQQAQTALRDPSLGIEKVEQPQTIVVDYSSPNLAKEMHVGHLRSTIIGDAQVRILTFLGHRVIRQNHVGDWGTQFGMLIAELEDHLGEGEQASLALKDLEAFYQQAKRHFDTDEVFAGRAREYVVKLQSGDARVLQLWRQFRDISLLHGEEIYQRLNVTLSREHICGESAYNNDLPVLVKDLCERGLAQQDQGALVMFLPELADKDDKPSVMIIQKQGGGYLYSTTDLAAMRYRVGTLHADRILFFIDARQSLHMQQVFTAARKAGYVSERVSLEHHAFGTMMGPDGKPFKTRSGDTVKLSDLLQEAEDRAEQLLNRKDTELSPQERKVVARKVGIGSVKYADLSKTRTNDYIFNWETMLSLEGNTAPYLQYAYTRIQSIFRRAGIDPPQLSSAIELGTDQERALALKLLQFSEVIEQVARDAYPHVLCGYLYDLSSLLMKFYEACPILKEGVTAQLRNSRLQLCRLVAHTLQTGLDLLGIETMDRM